MTKERTIFALFFPLVLVWRAGTAVLPPPHEPVAGRAIVKQPAGAGFRKKDVVTGKPLPGNTDTLKPGKKHTSEITGTYGEGRFRLIIRKNHRFKTVMAAPRPFVSKGTWEMHDDTLICREIRRNTKINNEGKKLKGRPVVYRFVVADGKLYSVVDGVRADNGMVRRGSAARK